MKRTKEYGRGLNSIRWRFGLASLVLTAGGFALRDWLGGRPPVEPYTLATLLLLALGAASITFALASRLTGSIAALKRSADRIAAGSFDSPVSLDCECEVGGLAQSFAQMTRRLNANLVRMNGLAYTDGVTGLPNRSALLHVLEVAFSAGHRREFRAAVLFLDLDDFKRVNDTLGHDAGDELLRQVGRRVVEVGLGRTMASIDMCTDAFGVPCQRPPNDVVFGRFAGDEFIAILPGVTDRVELTRIAGAVVSSLREPFVVGGQELSVGASVGVATTADQPASASELIAFADLAMYTAKQSGKAASYLFEQGLRVTMLEQAALERDLRLGIGRGELTLHYQPKVKMTSGTLCGVEALVRWQHPTRGLLPPSAFIDIAEQAGLMRQLGLEVLRLAAVQCRTWLDRGLAIPVAVNVSPSQFEDPGFAEHVLDVLHETGAPSHLISVEITESTAMSDFAGSVQRLASLRDAGLRIAIDDFGIGYSNLSELSRLPVDAIKVDRSLVRDIGKHDKTEAIIRAIVRMTHTLGYAVVAEGIETEEQHDFFARLGCEVGQGFLYGRPMVADALERWRCEPVRDRAPASGPVRTVPPPSRGPIANVG